MLRSCWIQPKEVIKQRKHKRVSAAAHRRKWLVVTCEHAQQQQRVGRACLCWLHALPCWGCCSCHQDMHLPAKAGA